MMIGSWHLIVEWTWVGWRWFPTQYEFDIAECLDWGPMRMTRLKKVM